MKTALIIAALLIGTAASETLAQGMCGPKDVFTVTLQRLGTDTIQDNGQQVPRTYGDVGVNGANIGRFYENPTVQIPTGKYRGVLRYRSDHNFVLSSCGQAGREGDFLLEIADVQMDDGTKRTNILLHPGFLPSHSQGCVLMGARTRNAAGELLPLAADSPLVKLRREFYGTDTPISCPDKAIVVEVRD